MFYQNCSKEKLQKYDIMAMILSPFISIIIVVVNTVIPNDYKYKPFFLLSAILIVFSIVMTHMFCRFKRIQKDIELDEEKERIWLIKKEEEERNKKLEKLYLTEISKLNVLTDKIETLNFIIKALDINSQTILYLIQQKFFYYGFDDMEIHKNELIDSDADEAYNEIGFKITNYPQLKDEYDCEEIKKIGLKEMCLANLKLYTDKE